MAAQLRRDQRATENPISALRGSWFAATSKAKKDALDMSIWRHRIQIFLARLISDKDGCFDLHRSPKGRTNCHCMNAIIMDDVERVAVVDYLVLFAQMTKTRQESLLLEWMRYSRMQPGSSSCCYFLPGSSTHKICKHACAKLIGYGERPWRRVTYFLANSIQPVHGLVGTNGNRSLSTVDKMQLVTFFSQMEEMGCPRATQIVRNFSEGTATTELRHDQDLIELPACYSKRHLWRRFLLDNGWEVKMDNKSRMVETIKVPNFEPALKECLSWPCFLQFWKDHYPNVVIQRARADICDDCFVFANQHRFGKRTKKVNPDSDDDDDDVDSNEEEVVSDDDVGDMEESEARILAAAKHVARARAQRELFNRKKQEAKDDRDKPRSERVYCFVADFAQNISLPNFAEEQPGATYYFSPMNVYPFGIVDCSTEPSQLIAYCYYEG
jgi:hypothetical protein